jgi:hypothetical protein
MSPDASPTPETDKVTSETPNDEPDAQGAAQEEAQERAPREPTVLVRHKGRDAAGGAVRRARSGFRRQGVVLDNGLRIRKQGRQRYTELDLRALVDNHENLLRYLDEDVIEILDAESKHVFTRAELVGILHDLAEDYGKKVAIPGQLMPPALLSAPPTGDMDPGDWDDDSDDADDDGDSDDADDEVDNEADTESEESSESSETTEEGGDTSGDTSGDTTLDPPKDVTRPDMDGAAMRAAADQAEAQKTGEANPPPSDDEDENYTKAELEKLSRVELDDIAKDNKIDPAEYSSKPKLITALLGEE